MIGPRRRALVVSLLYTQLVIQIFPIPPFLLGLSPTTDDYLGLTFSKGLSSLAKSLTRWLSHPFARYWLKYFAFGIHITLFTFT
jgi:hypothetical protein